MKTSNHRDLDWADFVRKAFCAVFCPCKHRPEPRACVTLGFGSTKVTFNISGKEKFMATVIDSGGPFNADVSGFVDSASNPVTDADIPVYAVADPTIATVVANDPAGSDPQGAVITLTKKLGNTDVTATFGDPANGGFVVTGNLNVIAGAAAGAVMAFSGPGIVPGA